MLMILDLNRILGTSQPNMRAGRLDDGAHVFVDTQVIAVTLNDGLLHGCNETIPSSYCEVYAPAGIMSWVRSIH